MAKRVDPLKAKEAKQKKIAIGGAVLLLALLGVQGPKTLKMLQGPAARCGAGRDRVPRRRRPASRRLPVRRPPAARRRPPRPCRSSRQSRTPISRPRPSRASSPPSSASPARIRSRSRPSRSRLNPPPSRQPKDGTEKEPAETKSDTKPADSAADGEAAADGGFTTGGSTPEAPAVAAATSISVNGVAEDVAVEGSFPKDEPTFVLVKIAKNGKSVEIGIAGGEYAGGDETITLALGKKLTLQNTADGSRYELELQAVQGFPLPKKK